MIKDRIQVRNEFLDNLENKLSKMEGTYNFDIAATTGVIVEKLYKLLDYWSKQTFIDTATEDEFIDNHAILFGVTRRYATKAKGEITITGNPNTEIQIGTAVLNRDGIKYVTLQSAFITQNGTVKIPIECTVGGNKGNCAAGEITSFEIANIGIYTVINDEPVIGGFDKEPNKELIVRAKERITKPAHSGNINDYIQWAKQVEGVGKVTVKPLWNGNGTVKVLVSNWNNEIADSELVRRVKERIEQQDGRPVGASVTVESFKNKAVNVTVGIILAPGSTLRDVEDTIKATVKTAIKSNICIFRKNNKDILSINRIEKELLNLQSLNDVFVQLNNDSNNLEINDDEMVKVGSVTVNER